MSAIITRKRLRLMDSRSSAAQSRTFPGRRLAVVAWAAAVLVVFMTLVPGAAEACPKHHESSGITGSVTIAHKTMHVAQVTAVLVSKTGVAIRGTHCCCGVCGHGAGCASGCCAACSTAIDTVSGGIELPDVLGSHGLSVQGKIVSPAPPPDFRPPRLFA
jgi:hypothetical protein